MDAIDLRAIAAKFKRFGLEGKRFGSLDDVKSAIDELISSTRSRFDMMELAVTLAQLPPERQRSSFDSWTQANRPSLKQFAPFAAHVTAVELFFQLAINSDLISPDRNSNRMDIAYLFYLPFCMTFVSSDKLHRKCASLFMRPDQSFTWGIDLKADLAQLNRHYRQKSTMDWLQVSLVPACLKHNVPALSRCVSTPARLHCPLFRPAILMSENSYIKALSDKRPLCPANDRLTDRSLNR